MKVLHDIIQKKHWYSFVDSGHCTKVKPAFDKGVECILKCQIIQDGKLTGWCQQHDNVNLSLQDARTFEPASLGGEESAEIVLFLMSLDYPSQEIFNTVQAGVEWMKQPQLLGIRVETIEAPTMVYKYSTSKIGRVVVEDPRTHRPSGHGFMNWERTNLCSVTETEYRFIL